RQGATVDQGMIVSLFPVNAIWVNSYVDYSLQPAAVFRRCGEWRNGCTGLSLQEWLPSGAY
ncbi:hypothetical protein ACV1CV_22430, partial [Aeromonas veronii]